MSSALCNQVRDTYINALWYLCCKGMHCALLAKRGQSCFFPFLSFVLVFFPSVTFDMETTSRCWLPFTQILFVNGDIRWIEFKAELFFSLFFFLPLSLHDMKLKLLFLRCKIECGSGSICVYCLYIYFKQAKSPINPQVHLWMDVIECFVHVFSRHVAPS